MPEGSVSSAEADRGKDAEESEDCNRVGQGEHEGRDEIPGKAFRIRRRIQLCLRLGKEAMASDQEKNAAADSAQPILVVEQQMGNRGDTEPCYNPENRIGSSGTKP